MGLWGCLEVLATGETFAFVYNPSGGKVSLTAEEQHGSLAIIHEDDDGITFRYRVLIKKRGGDYVQWGETGDEKLGVVRCCKPCARCNLIKISSCG